MVSELKVMELMMMMMFFISPEVAVVVGRVCTAFLTWPGQPSPGSQSQPKKIRKLNITTQITISITITTLGELGGVGSLGFLAR